MIPKILCILCGIGALAMSGLFMATLNFLFLYASVGFFVAFQFLFWKFLHNK